LIERNFHRWENHTGYTVAPITGANKGIGLQVAKDLASHGFAVLGGSRNFVQGEAAAKSFGADARAREPDVTKQASIAVAAERIGNGFGRRDVQLTTPASRMQQIRKAITLAFASDLESTHQSERTCITAAIHRGR
jgi:NAD(P)-dependent dehydrogenase (short-subunit alcohol dehydrogenase family)